MLEPIQIQNWDIPHGFFNRHGGLSTGLYHSLNCGLGSEDNSDIVQQNLDLVRNFCAADQLVTLRQVHSNQVVTVGKDYDHQQRPEADGFVTNQTGIALGVLSADCAPILFYDDKAGIIGAAHSGWKGAFHHIAAEVVGSMCAIGARKGDISVVVGPTIAQASYEVQSSFRDNFVQANPRFSEFFAAGCDNQHWQFDLEGFILAGLHRLDLDVQAGAISGVKIDTYPDENGYFSFRRATHLGQPDYGRQISAIALPCG